MTNTPAVAFVHEHSHWIPPIVAFVATAALSIYPWPLAPIVWAIEWICGSFPQIALLTNHPPQLVIALLIVTLVTSSLVGIFIGVNQWLNTTRALAAFSPYSGLLPDRLINTTAQLGLNGRVLVLDHQGYAAFCFGYIHPQIAVSTGIVELLDDEELLAVLAHERQHLIRRDPLRLLLLRSIGGGLFVLPAARFIRNQIEVRIELSADQAALSVSPSGALAGALVALLKQEKSTTIVGTAGISATESRVAYLSGRELLPEIPTSSIFASLIQIAALILTTINLSRSPDLVPMTCIFCSCVT